MTKDIVRTHALSTIAGAAAATIVFAIAASGGKDVFVETMGEMRRVEAPQVFGSVLLQGGVGGLLMAVIALRRPNPQRFWYIATGAALLLSFGLPLSAADDSMVVVQLAAMHIAAAAVIIPWTGSALPSIRGGDGNGTVTDEATAQKS